VVDGSGGPAIAAERVVGSFPSPGGDPLTLVRVRPAEAIPADGLPDERPATLEEVVIGHMAAGRVRRAARRAEEAA
jgi:hypothetical protein